MKSYQLLRSVWVLKQVISQCAQPLNTAAGLGLVYLGAAAAGAARLSPTHSPTGESMSFNWMWERSFG